MSGANDDLDSHRKLLQKLIDVLNRIPFVKPTKSNKTFVIPYKTIFTVLEEYTPLDNDFEKSLLADIDQAFKSENAQHIETTKTTLIQYLQQSNTTERLFKALNDSIDCCDDTFVRILDFFKQSCSHLISQKRNAPHSTSGPSGPSGPIVSPDTFALTDQHASNII